MEETLFSGGWQACPFLLRFPGGEGFERRGTASNDLSQSQRERGREVQVESGGQVRKGLPMAEELLVLSSGARQKNSRVYGRPTHIHSGSAQAPLGTE